MKNLRNSSSPGILTIREIPITFDQTGTQGSAGSHPPVTNARVQILRETGGPDSSDPKVPELQCLPLL